MDDIWFLIYFSGLHVQLLDVWEGFDPNLLTVGAAKQSM